MAEFRFREKKTEVRLSVKKEKSDGTEVEKVLVFDCSPQNYSFINRIAKAAADLRVKMQGYQKEAEDSQGSIGLVSAIVGAEKEIFEATAPGKWDEYFAFLDEDVQDMADLIGLMVNTIVEKGTAEKKKTIESKAPDGAAEVI